MIILKVVSLIANTPILFVGWFWTWRQTSSPSPRCWITQAWLWLRLRVTLWQIVRPLVTISRLSHQFRIQSAQKLIFIDWIFCLRWRLRNFSLFLSSRENWRQRCKFFNKSLPHLILLSLFSFSPLSPSISLVFSFSPLSISLRLFLFHPYISPFIAPSLLSLTLSLSHKQLTTLLNI